MRVAAATLVLLSLAGCIHTRTLRLRDVPAPAPVTGPNAGALWVEDARTTTLGESPEGAFLFVFPVTDRFVSSRERGDLVAGTIQSALMDAGLAFETRTDVWRPDALPASSGRVALVVKVKTAKIANKTMFAVLGMVPSSVEARVMLEARVIRAGAAAGAAATFEGTGRAKHGEPGAAFRDALLTAARDLVARSGVREAALGAQNDAFASATVKAKEAETAGDLPLALAVLSRAFATAPDRTRADGLFDDIARVLNAMPAKPALSEKDRRTLVQAELSARERRFDEAIGLYATLGDAAPWYAPAYFNRAVLLAERGRYAEAIDAMKRYLKLAPDASDARAATDKVYEWEARLKR